MTLSCWVSTGTRAGKNTFPLTSSHSHGGTVNKLEVKQQQEKGIFSVLSQKAEKGVEGWAAPAVAKPSTLPGKG